MRDWCIWLVDVFECMMMHGLTYLLTPWSRVFLDKLTVNFAASQEIPRIYGTRKFLTVPTSARYLSLSWSNSIQSPRPPPTFWRSILKMHGLTNPKCQYVFIFTPSHLYFSLAMWNVESRVAQTLTADITVWSVHEEMDTWPKQCLWNVWHKPLSYAGKHRSRTKTSLGLHLCELPTRQAVYV
jgi:hypothetical protein